MKRQISFITGNKSKFMEAKLILKGIKLVRKDLKLIEPKTLSQEEVVLEKAAQAYRLAKGPVIVDDTCIYFDAYKDFPGTDTKLVFQSLGFKGIFRLLNGAKRSAHFRTLVCYKDRTRSRVFEGTWRGRITAKPSQSLNPEWEYSSIFIPEGFSKPLSEIPMDVRAKFSHRKKAFGKLARFLK